MADARLCGEGASPYHARARATDSAVGRNACDSIELSDARCEVSR
jgi:hypothetical protein